MSDILVSIIESVADAAAAARARRQQASPQAAVPWQPRDDQPPAVVPRQTPEPAPVVLAVKAKPRAETPPSEPVGRRIEPRRLFADPQSLIRTVVATEILGPPLALRRQNLWDLPGV